MAACLSVFDDRPRVLIVEDDAVVLADLENTLDELGYRVTRKARNLVDGLIVARRPDFDVAILDMNLAGLTSLRIADTLIERDIPFLLITGYTAGGVPDRFGHVVRLSKPIEKAVLEKALQDLLSGNPSAPAR